MGEKTFGTKNQARLAELIGFQDVEIQIIYSQLIDTLSPSLASSEACQIILQLLMQNVEYIKKYGASEKAIVSQKQLKRLFELVSSLNAATGEMNTLQLQNRNFYSEMVAEKIKSRELQKQLDAIKSAEEWQQKN